MLVAVSLELAAALWRAGKKQNADCRRAEELKRSKQQLVDAQARESQRPVRTRIAQQNYAAIRSVSETLQTAVQSMSTTLGQGQDSQQRILERRLQSLEQANNQQMEQLRRAMVESMTALQAENTRKLDEIRHTVDEQLAGRFAEAGDGKLQGRQRSSSSRCTRALARCSPSPPTWAA